MLLGLHSDEGLDWLSVLGFDNGGWWSSGDEEDGDCTKDNGNPCCGG